MSALPVSLEAVLQTARVVRGIDAKDDREKNVLCMHSEEGAALAEALPDGGFPKGLVELTAPLGAGGATTLSLTVIASLHAQRPDAHAAWVELSGERRLHAPAVLAKNVDLGRLLVVRAPVDKSSSRSSLRAAPRSGQEGSALARAAIRVVESGAFGVVCIAFPAHRAAALGEREARRIQLAAEETGTVVLALTDAYEAHAPWPSVLRLSLQRGPESIHVRVVKERRGRIGQRITLRAS